MVNMKATGFTSGPMAIITQEILGKALKKALVFGNSKTNCSQECSKMI